MAIQLSGSLEMLGNIVASGGFTGSFSGSATSASYADTLQGLGSASFAPAGTFNTVSQSFATTSGSIASRVNVIETSYATTGSNTFTNPQQISDVSNAISFTSTASLYTDGGLRVKGNSFVSGTAYFNDVVVYGTSSIEYITSSQLAIGTNIITLNTDTPSVRFGGISVFDSGSNNLSTGSLFWDSEKDKWIYSNPSASTYDGGMLISGPRNTSGLGNEVGTTSCALMMGQGGDHITSSAIFHYGTATCFYGNALFVSSSCNVGIGTSSPNYTTAGRTVLALDGSTSALYALQNTGTSAGYVYGDASSVVLWAEGSRNLTVGVAAGGCTILTTNNSSRLTISPVGNATFTCNVTAAGRVYGTTTGLNSDFNAGGLIAYSCGSTLRYTQVGFDCVGNYGWIQALEQGVAYRNLVLNGAGGNVGINTASPSTLLHLNSTSTQLTLQNTDGGTNAERIGMYMTGGDTFKILSLCDNNTTRVDNILVANVLTGNVGIGTASTTSKLTILKTITTNPGATGNAALSLGTAGSAGEYNLINFGYDSESWQPAYMGYLTTSGAGSSNGALVFATRGDTTNSQPAERMRINCTGAVGIGTTNLSTEANLFLGAQGTVEGGQLVLQKGTSCSCATHLDNYQDSFRVLVGSDTTSTGVNMVIDHKTRNACLYGNLVVPSLVISDGGFMKQNNCYYTQFSTSAGASSSITIDLVGSGLRVAGNYTTGKIYAQLGLYPGGGPAFFDINIALNSAGSFNCSVVSATCIGGVGVLSITPYSNVASNIFCVVIATNCSAGISYWRASGFAMSA